MINIHTMHEQTVNKKENSEKFVKYVYSDIFIYSKASSIAFTSAENIVASSGSLAENTSLLITGAAATLF